jgi:coenzyme F420-reducing hydrogenase delta subunit
VSASEGEQFAEVVHSVTERVKALGPASRLVKQLDAVQAA